MGWYGNYNTGDEAVLAGLLCQIRQRLPNARITVFSDSPDDTAARHAVRARWSLPWRASDIFGKQLLWHLRTGMSSLLALARSDLCVIGGGGIIADHSAQTVRCWCHRIRMARFFAKTTAVYGVGVEPLAHRNSRQLVQRTFSALPLVVCRDEESAGELARCGVKDNVMVSSDPAFTVRPALRGVSREQIASAEGAIIVCPVGRYRGDTAREYGGRIAEGVERFMNESSSLRVLLGAMMPGDEFLEEYLRPIKGYKGILALYDLHPSSAAGLLGLARAVVGSRLHSLILASLSSVAIVPVVYDVKVESFAKLVGLDDVMLEFGDGVVWRKTMFEPSRLAASLRSVTSRRPAYESTRIDRLRALAETGADALVKLLHGESVDSRQEKM